MTEHFGKYTHLLLMEFIIVVSYIFLTLRKIYFLPSILVALARLQIFILQICRENCYCSALISFLLFLRLNFYLILCLILVHRIYRTLLEIRAIVEIF